MRDQLESYVDYYADHANHTHHADNAFGALLPIYATGVHHVDPQYQSAARANRAGSVDFRLGNGIE
jgi:hypothetical protein